MEEKFLSKIIRFDPQTRYLTLRLDFLTPDKQEALENLIKDDAELNFCFNKAYRRSKTYPQLKCYYGMLNEILKKLDVFPDADTIRALDLEIKKNVFPAQFLELYTVKIPLVPSKSNMSVEELKLMIGYVKDTYAEILTEFEE